MPLSKKQLLLIPILAIALMFIGSLVKEFFCVDLFSNSYSCRGFPLDWYKTSGPLILNIILDFIFWAGIVLSFFLSQKLFKKVLVILLNIFILWLTFTPIVRWARLPIRTSGSIWEIFFYKIFNQSGLPKADEYSLITIIISPEFWFPLILGALSLFFLYRVLLNKSININRYIIASVFLLIVYPFIYNIIQFITSFF